MQVVSLHRYPVKSLGGEDLSFSAVEPRGLAGDRRWMVTTPEGRFLTRRELPAMAGLHVRWQPGAIELVRADGDAEALTVAEPVPGAPVSVTVWRDRVLARDAGDLAAQWLSQALDRSVRLVHFADDAVRGVDPAFAQPGDEVGFADGFPLLITLVESLDALNAQLPEPMTMARFRANVVLAGAPAFAEAQWTALRIGALHLRVVKPCTRCVITTQDPASGLVTTPMEPLRTLKALGQVLPGTREPVFGQNAIPDSAGTIRVGDRVELIA